MKAGKLSESALKRSVLKQLHNGNSVVSPMVGGDYAAVQAKESMVVQATGARCCGGSLRGVLSVYNALNNLACSGAKPLGITLTLLLPTSCSENDLRRELAAIQAVCDKEEIPILGGHTEVTRSVTEPVISITATGTTDTQLIRPGQVEPGMDLLVTKAVGLECTTILAIEKEKELLERYAQPFIDQAKKFVDYLSIRSEAAVAAQSGVAAMHDISEGGVFGALWELGQSSGVGLEIELKKIPLRQETVEICEFFNLNPYKMVSGGSVLMAAKDGNAIVHAIRQAGGEAVIIGKATDSNDRVLINGDERRFLETTQTDELMKL